MSETVTPPPAGLNSLMWKVVQGVELVDVRVVRWHGELVDFHATKVEGLDPDFRVDFRNDAESMQLRWAFDTVLRSPTGRDVAALGLSLIQSFTFIDPGETHPILSGELMREFAEQVAIVSIMPFVREAVHTMTTRLGLPAVTLGLMKPGSPGPQSFSVRGGGS